MPDVESDLPVAFLSLIYFSTNFIAGLIELDPKLKDFNMDDNEIELGENKEDNEEASLHLAGSQIQADNPCTSVALDGSTGTDLMKMSDPDIIQKTDQAHERTHATGQNGYEDLNDDDNAVEGSKGRSEHAASQDGPVDLTDDDKAAEELKGRSEAVIAEEAVLITRLSELKGKLGAIQFLFVSYEGPYW